MKMYAKSALLAVLCLSFSVDSYAWGSWGRWLDYRGSATCRATHGDGNERKARIWQKTSVVCGDEGCWGVAWAEGKNESAANVSLDLNMQSRKGSSSPFINKTRWGLGKDQFYSYRFDVGNFFDNITTRCRVQ